MEMKDVLYVLGLKKNLLFISTLDKKGFRVAFVDGKVLMWTKGKNKRKSHDHRHKTRGFKKYFSNYE